MTTCRDDTARSSDLEMPLDSPALAADTQDTAVNFRNAEGPLDARGGLMVGSFYRALRY